ncbi:MAG: hypothetical protein JWR80_3300 [Bradyrhizobium sp.]|nr:hypothetical protein [Bradyrhizobium sp.]
MRFHFPNLDRPKKAAKRIVERLGQALPLSTVHRGLAVALGYRDWHELEIAHTGAPPTPLDQHLADDAFHRRTADLVLKLSAALGFPDSEAQYALLASRLTGDRTVTFDDQFNIRMMCWQAKGSWPTAGSGGTVVRLRSSAAGPRRLSYLTSDFDSSRDTVIQIAGDNFFGIAAREDFAIPREPLLPFLPSRLRFAYGAWTEADGTRVLFSRDYAPMWRLRDGHPPRPASPFEWIKFTREEWFWEDATAPWRDRRRIAEEEARLVSLDVPGLSPLADLLPQIIASTGTVPSPSRLLRLSREPKALAS